MFTDADPTHDRRVATNRGIATDSGRQANPVVRGLQRAIIIYGTRVRVIDKHDAVTYKDAVLDRDTRAEKAMARDLAVHPDLNIALNLYEWTDAGTPSNPAAIEVDKIGLMNDHIRSKRYVWRNHYRNLPFFRTIVEDLRLHFAGQNVLPGRARHGS
jgi:hypothetical protein